eukprot:TRINITY_DN9507_c0_g1_i1.p1 TRINITY_DN9507_c0_g1~~TRINITY_DN9507_c0_g1_i1.p1  ORF type:complete len:435 (-),score=99.84 TRINITY_DN9507_c0_g1_i1:38-1207(-)
MIASASDDKKIILWDVETGSYLFMLGGHEKQVTSLLHIDPNILISGSSDRTIKVWDLSTRMCLKTLSDHKGSVKCLVKTKLGFCSGDSEREIIFWDAAGNKIGEITRREEESLNCLMVTRTNRILTASSSSLIYVYGTVTYQFEKFLGIHRESVKCLSSTQNSSIFLSGSSDGMIVMWNEGLLTPLGIVSDPENPKPVWGITLLSERCFGAAIGSGFRIFDIATEDCILEVDEAHKSDVSSMITLFEGRFLVTCSADSAIKLWDISAFSSICHNGKFIDPVWTKSKELKPKEISVFHYFRTHPNDAKAPFMKNSLNAAKNKPVRPQPLGELLGHTEHINSMVKLSDKTFASCGRDALILLWKDADGEFEKLNAIAREVLIEKRPRNSSI